MSQTSPFGPPAVDDPTGQAPAVETAGPPEKKPRFGLLAIGGAAIVAAAAVIGFLLMSGTSDDDLGLGGPLVSVPRATEAPQPSLSPTPLPTESTVNARNPFLAPPSPTPTAAPSSSSTTTPAAAAPTAPAATTTTEAKKDVFVTLVKFNKTNGDATFKVISPAETGKTSWPVAVGDRFGKPWGSSSTKPFTYDGVFVKSNGDWCASVKLVDAETTRVCKGEIVQVQ